MGKAVPQRKPQPKKSFEAEYDPVRECVILTVLDSDGMYPFLLRDPKAGTYKVIKTAAGKLKMDK